MPEDKFPEATKCTQGSVLEEKLQEATKQTQELANCISFLLFNYIFIS